MLFELGSGESPKMKNFMKKPRVRITKSWPKRRPWVKDQLVG